jgi:hypothetical protein
MRAFDVVAINSCSDNVQVIKFNTSLQTWGRIIKPVSSSVTSARNVGSSYRSYESVLVDVEGAVVRVPKRNIIGHYSDEVALVALMQYNGNGAAALRALCAPAFRYSPQNCWRADELAALKRAAEFARQPIDYDSTTLPASDGSSVGLASPSAPTTAHGRAGRIVHSGDGPHGDLNVDVFYREKGRIEGRTAKEVVSFVLQFSPPDSPAITEAGSLGKRKRNNSAEDAALRAVRVIKGQFFFAQYQLIGYLVNLQCARI